MIAELYLMLNKIEGKRIHRGGHRVILAGVSLLLPATMSHAQQDAPELRGAIKVDVTGSNIRRIDGEAALPLQIITRQELIDGGIQTMQDLLQRISANQSFGSFNPTLGIGSSVVGFTSASLRGLGAERTLILLNGRRLAPYALSGGQAVDLSGVPPSAIERVEILLDGASAIYGTDAIGGVINFILRQDYRGAELNGNYYATQQGGGNNWRVSGTAGYGNLASDKYNVFVTADYFKQDALKASQRDFTRTAYIPDLGYDQTSLAAFPSNIIVPEFRFYNPTIPYPGGATPESCFSPYSFPTARDPYLCSFNAGSLIDTIPASETVNVVGRAVWQFDPAHQVFAEATYYRGTFTQRIAPTPVFPSFFGGPDGDLPPSSPFYPAAFVNSVGGDPTLPLPLLYRTVELGPRTDQGRSAQWTAVAGLQGTWNGWSYAIAGNFVRNEQDTSLVSGWLSSDRLGALMRTGDVNPFGFNTASVVDRMRATQITGPITNNTASNYGGDFKVSGDAFSLPAGMVAVAAGLEGRRESLEQRNSDAVTDGDIVGGVGGVPSLTTSYRTVLAAFGEVNVPVTKAFEVNVALRYDHYSDFGGTTNPKVALRWQPAQQLLLRASYGTGFRAPTLSNLHQPAGEGFDDTSAFDDPIRCPVTGADVDCRHTSNFPFPYTTLIGGNPLLQPEKSTQWNVGVVWQPDPAFSARLDYFNVEVRNLISYATGQVIGENFAALSPTQVIRKPPDTDYPVLPGEIDHLITQPVNFGTLKTSGFDVDLRYRSPATSAGRFTASLAGTYINDYTLTNLVSGEFPGGAGARGPIGAIARWRHYATLGWELGPWGATLANTLQWGYSEPCLEFDSSACKTRRVGTYSTWDLQGRYTGLRNLTLTVGVLNLAGTQPPVTNQGWSFQSSYDPSYADPRGRTFYGAVRYALD